MGDVAEQSEPGAQNRVASHDLLAPFWGYSRFRVFLLKFSHNLISYCLHICGRERAERRGSQQPINNALQNTDSEFRVDDRISKVNSSDRDAHGDLFGARVCLGSDVPRFRIFFVKNGSSK